MNREWLQEKWYEFRLGHSSYWGFALSLINFSLILYGFLISEIDFLSFNNPLEFAVVLTIIYIPITTLTGHLHRKYQMKVDFKVAYKEIPQITEIQKQLERIEKILKGEEK